MRRVILQSFDDAVRAGARRGVAAKKVGLSLRTIERWREQREGGEDRRRGPVTPPANRLSEAERAKILEIATAKEYRDLSPKLIVPKLADQGVYLASESSFYRVLRDAKQMAHRGRSRAARNPRPRTLVATAPRQVWSWDITYLRAAIRGLYYRLFLTIDVFSRKIVAWTVHEEESAEHAAAMIEDAARREGVERDKLTLHSDNGGPMKGFTLIAKLESLGIATSYSRPRTSDDNPFSESLFRTLKYRPEYPEACFASLDHARAWVARFVHWYNELHLHSAIDFVTPSSRHDGRDMPILAARAKLYRAARRRRPDRWTRGVRDWTRVAKVALNPERTDRMAPAEAAA